MNKFKFKKEKYYFKINYVCIILINNHLFIFSSIIEIFFKDNVSKFITNNNEKFFSIFFALMLIIIFQLQINVNIEKSKISNFIDKEKLEYISRKCYFPSNNNYTKIIHLIFTKFMIEFKSNSGFNLLIYNKK